MMFATELESVIVEMSDLNKFFIENKIEFIQFQFTTVFGELKSVEFPANIWEEMQEGSGVDGSSLGFLQNPSFS